jgi:hypothetical protein
MTFFTIVVRELIGLTTKRKKYRARHFGQNRDSFRIRRKQA